MLLFKFLGQAIKFPFKNFPVLLLGIVLIGFSQFTDKATKSVFQYFAARSLSEIRSEYFAIRNDLSEQNKAYLDGIYGSPAVQSSEFPYLTVIMWSIIGIGLWYASSLASVGLVQAVIDEDNGNKINLVKIIKSGTRKAGRLMLLELLWVFFIILGVLALLAFSTLFRLSGNAIEWIYIISLLIFLPIVLISRKLLIINDSKVAGAFHDGFSHVKKDAAVTFVIFLVALIPLGVFVGIAVVSLMLKLEWAIIILSVPYCIIIDAYFTKALRSRLKFLLANYKATPSTILV